MHEYGARLRGANLLELWSDVLSLSAFTLVITYLAIMRFRKWLD